jgi:hypothetical protein
MPGGLNMMKTYKLISFVLPMLLLGTACSRDTTAPALSNTTPAETAPAKNADWLQAALHCGDADFLRLSHEEQKVRMQQDPRWQCESLDVQGGPILQCTPTEPQQAFASRIFAVSFHHPMGAHQMAVQVQNDVETLKQTAANIWHKAYNEESNVLNLNDDGSVALHFDADNGGDNLSSITCAIAPGANNRPTLPANWQKQNTEPVLPVSEAYPIDTESDQGVPVLKGDVLLKALMTCGADHWLSLSFKQRVDALQSAGAKCKDEPAYSGDGKRMHQATCSLPRGVKSFDGSAQTMIVMNDDGERHETRITIDRTPKQLAAAMQKATMTDLSPYPGSAGMYQNLLDDRIQHIVFPHKKTGFSELVCRLSKEANNVAGPINTNADDSTIQHEDHHTMPSGSISGNIQYPSENIPAIRICAIHDNGAIYGCTRTKLGQGTYRIDNLAAADYVLVAEFNEGDMRAGAHANAIRCIRAPCPQSTLIPVTINPGDKKTGININEYLGDRGEWPALPADDGR